MDEGNRLQEIDFFRNSRSYVLHAGSKNKTLHYFVIGALDKELKLFLLK